jgi:hypothetical protein
MQKLWNNYFETFKILITSGWKIFKSDKSSVYTWVYVHTTLPTKFRLKEANVINNTATNSNRFFGSTRVVPYACSMFYSAEACIQGKWSK